MELMIIMKMWNFGSPQSSPLKNKKKPEKKIPRDIGWICKVGEVVIPKKQQFTRE